MVEKTLNRLEKQRNIYKNTCLHLVAAVVLLLANGDLFDMFCKIVSISAEQELIYKLCLALFTAMIWLTWGMSFFLTTICELYRTKTQGRNLLSDTMHYKMNYFDLVDKLKDADPLRLDVKDLPSKHWTESKGLVFGKVGDKLVEYDPTEAGRNGIVCNIWGSPGVGKTSANIVPMARQFQGSVMVADLKGDIYKANKDYRTIKRFSTIDWKNSAHFDPLGTIRTAPTSEQITMLENLAITVIPGDGSSDGEYFTKGARDFLVGITLYHLEKDINTPFPAIIESIVQSDFVSWVNKIKDSDSQGKKWVSNFYGQNEKNVGGCYAQCVSSTRLFCSEIMKTLLTYEEGNTISYQDLEDGTDVYIQLSPVSLEVYSPLITMIFEAFMSSVLYRPEHSPLPLCFIIDEFGSFGFLPILFRAVSLFRAYNASLVFSCQSLSMLDKVYGQNGRQIFLDCVKVHVFHSLQDPVSRDWASKLFGIKKSLRTSNSIQTKDGTTSKTITEVREPVFEPTTFGVLPETDEIIISYNGKYIKGEKTYYFKD